ITVVPYHTPCVVKCERSFQSGLARLFHFLKSTDLLQVARTDDDPLSTPLRPIMRRRYHPLPSGHHRHSIHSISVTFERGQFAPTGQIPPLERPVPRCGEGLLPVRRRGHCSHIT